MTRPSRPDGPDPAPTDFFDADYRRVLEPFHPESEARRETAALRDILALAQEDRVLDLACGWGRHLALLVGAGHHVTGVDFSHDLLRQVPLPEPRPLAAADMRALPLPDASFDVVLNLATSLGLFLDDEPALAALREVRRVLRPGGRLLLEGMHREDVEAGFAPRVRWFLDDGTEVRARRRFDRARGISEEVLRWRGPAGSGEKRHTLRIRSAAEMTGLVEAAGLDVDRLYGDWSLDPFEPASPRLVLLARRGGAPDLREGVPEVAR